MNAQKQIAKSVDFRYFLKGLLLFGSFGILFIILAIGSSALANSTASAVSCLAAFFFSSIAIYYTVRIILLYQYVQEYQLYTATIAEVHNAPCRSYYFVLNICTENGSSFQAESNGVFTTSEFSSSYFGDYLNKSLQVLYNSKSKAIIVIGELI